MQLLCFLKISTMRLITGPKYRNQVWVECSAINRTSISSPYLQWGLIEPGLGRTETIQCHLDKRGPLYLWTQNSHGGLHKTWTRSGQQTSSRGWGWGGEVAHEIPLLTEDDWWMPRVEIKVSLGVWIGTCVSEWPQFCGNGHAHSTQWIIITLW